MTLRSATPPLSSRRLVAVYVTLALCGGAIGPGQEPPAADLEPTTRPVLEAIRLLLSSDSREEARGEVILRKMGRRILPQLRYWVRRIRGEASRVELVLLHMVGAGPAEPDLETTSTSEFLYRKLHEARGLIEGGRHAEALRVIEAILVLDPASPHGWQLRRLARHARQRLATRDLLEPSLAIDRVAYDANEKPSVRFVLRNHAREPVRVELDRGFLGEIDAQSTYKFREGAERVVQRRFRIAVDPSVSEIVLGPGRFWEHAVDLYPDEPLPLGGVIVRVQVSARFRPRRWGHGESGSSLENLSIEVPRSEFWIVPTGTTSLCDRPLESLTAALLFGRDEALFVAGWAAVWAGQEDAYLNQSLLETLIAHVDDLPAQRLRLVAGLLAEATWLDHGEDPAKWKKWWASQYALEASETSDRSAVPDATGNR